MQSQSQMITNPKTEVPNTPQLNDRDYTDMILNTCKKMVDSYAIALNECSNDSYYNMLFKIFQETSQAQRRLYNLMFRKGWYSIESEQQQKIMQTIQKETSKRQQIQ
ncbi:MAG TPA: spore coat protein [Haloplasmataceae bacterium]